MNPLSKLLPVGEILEKIGGIIDKVHTSPEEKLKAQRELVSVELDFQKAMASVDVEWAKMQASVIIAEAQGSSWAQRNWRPVSMLAFVTVILYQYIIAPIFGLTTVPVLPDDLWSVIQVGFGGYIFGRTVEKVAPDVTKIVLNRKP